MRDFLYLGTNNPYTNGTIRGLEATLKIINESKDLEEVKKKIKEELEKYQDLEADSQTYLDKLVEQ